MPSPRPKLTLSISLPGGQDRLRQMILYVSAKCADAERFGLIKLNKIIWKADFDSFAARGTAVTGRAYKRQKFGPVATDMMPLYSEMLRDGLISIERVDFGDGVIEKRTTPQAQAKLDRFSLSDLAFVEESIQYYWQKTGEEPSDDSHGVAWSTRSNGEDMPYELAYLSDASLGLSQRLRLEDRMLQEGWVSE